MPASNVLPRRAQLRVERFEQTDHRRIRQGIILRERELRHQRGSALIGEGRAERVERSHGGGGVLRDLFSVAASSSSSSEPDDANLANLQSRHGARQQHHGLEREVAARVLRHGLGVVDGQHHLVPTLRRSRAPEPNLILSEIAGDVRDDLAHVQAFPRAEISLQTTRQRRLQNETQLFREFAGEGARE